MSLAPVMEVVPCAVCGGSQTRRALVRAPVDEFSDELELVNGRASWVVCEGCGLVYQSPRPAPDAVRKLYEGGDYHENRGGIPDFYIDYSLRRSREAIAWGLDQPTLRGRSGRAFDIGAGIGGALVCLRERGWDVTGVEPDPNLAAFGREHFDLDIIDGFFGADTFSADEHFDLAYSCHVWEHLADPRATAAAARALLQPEGHLLIVVPTFRQSRTLAWSCFGSPHTYMWTETSLGNLLRLAGFDVLAHRFVSRSDSELWMLARVAPTPRDAEDIGRDRPAVVQLELATVPLRMPLGVPGRLLAHLRVLWSDPGAFAARAARWIRSRARRARIAVRGRR
jgi:SAM-dependent methyltransferase